jgi:hypothetical protein
MGSSTRSFELPGTFANTMESTFSDVFRDDNCMIQLFEGYLPYLTI